jgi:hypothetical protein
LLEATVFHKPTLGIALHVRDILWDRRALKIRINGVSLSTTIVHSDFSSTIITLFICAVKSAA